jgi:hypothetical protein
MWSCEIPIESFEEAPFSLQIGDEIIAKVYARNRIGRSEESSSGSGAIVMTKPEPPTFVATIMTDDGQRVHISFVAPSYNGGSTITEYKYFIKPDHSSIYQEVEVEQITPHSAEVSALVLKADPWGLRDGSKVMA